MEIAGLWQFYDLLKKKLESPLFLEKLGGPHGAVASSVDASLFENVVGKPEGGELQLVFYKFLLSPL